MRFCYNGALTVVVKSASALSQWVYKVVGGKLGGERKHEYVMDDVYAINLAKTEFREAYDTGNVERLLAIVDSDLIDCSNGRRSGYGEGAKTALRTYLQDLFAEYHAHLVPIIIEIKILGELAVDYGWHELTLTPKNGGEPIRTRTRYLDLWKKDKAGTWKLAMFMDNPDVPDQLDAAIA
jgi:ketosteroid isomerase-like protein